MFNRDTITPAFEQAVAMAKIYSGYDRLKEKHHQLGFLKWAAEQLASNDTPLSIEKLYEVEDAILATINTAIALTGAGSLDLVHHINVVKHVTKTDDGDKLKRTITVMFFNVFSRQTIVSGDAYDTLINVALSDPDSIHFQALEWLKRNDYPGFRSALSGRPREEFENLVA